MLCFLALTALLVVRSQIRLVPRSDQSFSALSMTATSPGLDGCARRTPRAGIHGWWAKWWCCQGSSEVARCDRLTFVLLPAVATQAAVGLDGCFTWLLCAACSVGMKVGVNRCIPAGASGAYATSACTHESVHRLRYALCLSHRLSFHPALGH